MISLVPPADDALGTVVLRICIVDDHQIVLDGLESLTARQDGLELVGSGSTLADAKGLLERLDPDVLILDLMVHGENSLPVCAELSSKHPRTKYVIFSGFGNAELLRQAVRSGASGYLLKDTGTSRIADALAELQTTGTCFDPRLSGSLLGKSLGDRKSAEAFTERELEIVTEIAKGGSNYDIAEELSVSSHTVKFHISAMLKKHQVHTRSELVKLAMSLHLLDE